MFNPASAKWIIFFYLNDFNSAVHPTPFNKNEKKLSVYPNPCKDYLTIENQSFTADDYLLEILDLSGRSLIKQPIYLSTIDRVDVSSLESGIYVLRINNQEFLFNTLFVKN